MLEVLVRLVAMNGGYKLDFSFLFITNLEPPFFEIADVSSEPRKFLTAKCRVPNNAKKYKRLRRIFPNSTIIKPYVLLEEKPLGFTRVDDVIVRKLFGETFEKIFWNRNFSIHYV